MFASIAVNVFIVFVKEKIENLNANTTANLEPVF